MRFYFAVFLFLNLTNSFGQYDPKFNQYPNPKTTGAYAFAFIDHATDPKIGDHVVIDARIDGGIDNLGNVQGGMIRIRIPFVKWIEIEANAVADRWQISEETREKFGINKTSGNFDGDMNFKTKIRILKQNEHTMKPDLSFMVTTKAAAGDFDQTHRYTDSAGYEFSILGAKDFYEDHNTIITKIRFLMEMAFIAWDTANSEQNDAFKVSSALQIEAANDFKVKISFLGFYGWQEKRVDHVNTVQLEVNKKISKRVEVYGQANFGISKAATPLLVGGGVRINLNPPKPRRRTPKNPFDQ